MHPDNRIEIHSVFPYKIHHHQFSNDNSNNKTTKFDYLIGFFIITIIFRLGLVHIPVIQPNPSGLSFYYY